MDQQEHVQIASGRMQIPHVISTVKVEKSEAQAREEKTVDKYGE